MDGTWDHEFYDISGRRGDGWSQNVSGPIPADAPDGEYLSYWPNGRLYARAWFSKGLPDGEWQFFGQDGESWHEHHWEMGKFVRAVFPPK